MIEVGSIVANRGIVYKDQKLGKSLKTGRNCLVIAMDDTYYYYLNSFTENSIELNNPKYKSKFLLEKVYRAPICFKKGQTTVGKKKLLSIYKEFIKYHEDKEKCEYYDEVMQYINDYINKHDKQKSKQYILNS